MNTIQAELLPLSWSVTSKGGAKIVFQVSSEEELDLFKGLEGKRLQGVFVAIGDDETPEPTKPEIRPTKQRLSQVAAILCGDPEFQTWMWENFVYNHGDPAEVVCQQNCTSLLRVVCGIQSRAELDSNQEAADKFHDLIRIPFTERKRS